MTEESTAEPIRAKQSSRGTRDSSRVVIYLGYHKTASKWIWKNVFTERYPHQQINLVRQSADSVWDAIEASQGPFIVRQRLEEGLMGEEIPELATTISHNFPNARIVLGIRSQHSMVASHYGQYVTNGGRMGLAAYLNKAVQTKWHYQRVLEPFFELFPERVHVYLFEDLRRNSFELLCHLRDFVGPPEGGLPDDEVRYIANQPPMNPQRHDLVIDTMLTLNRLRMRHRKNTIFPEIRRRGHDHIFVELAEYLARKYSNRTGRPLRYRKFDDRGILAKVYGAENRALSAFLSRSLADDGYPS
ncbi:MAG: hypothetical protein CL573_01850 [Alphaproteobacteria bacterium]|nr:hypothetical protein [Alphaproteobacteria bacterium]HCP00461.1 hypothetical protein [Rhodospirillaceae bacterium]|tara:strand:- start:414 stop:1319 length:906 start_codon:yes stop_codon:yes gene_type:complete